MKVFLSTLAGLMFLFLGNMAHASCPAINPNNNAPPFVDGCDVPAVALNRLAALVTPQTTTNAALVALPVPTVGSQVIRQGFYAPGDGGSAVYTFSSTNCTVNSGAGDNGSQVKPGSGNGCWNADFSVIPANIRQWGAKGDCATNDSPAIQAAGNTGLTIIIPQGDFLIGTNLVWNQASPPHFVGMGWNETGLAQLPTNTSGCTTADGSYLSVTSTSISAITITGFSPGQGYASFRNIAFLEKQPAPGGGWSPNVYPPLVTLDGSVIPVGGTQFNNIGLGAVTQFVYGKGNAARIQMDKIYGQVFGTNGAVLLVEDALDASRANDWHIWGFWSLDPNVLAYQDANTVVVRFDRQDDWMANNIFMFQQKVCIQLSQWTGSPYGVAGPPAGIQIGNFNCDGALYGVWADSTSSSFAISIDHWWHGGENIAGTPITGSNAIQIDGVGSINVNDINIIAVANSVVNSTATGAGPIVRIHAVHSNSGTTFAWNYNGSTYCSGTNPTFNIAAATIPAQIWLDTLAQPEDCGIQANSSGIINTNSNAFLYAKDGSAYLLHTSSNGETFNIPNWVSKLILTGGVSTTNLRLGNTVALDGRAWTWQCNSTITTVSVSNNSGGTNVVNPPTTCTAGTTYGMQYLFGLGGGNFYPSFSVN